MGSGKRMVIAGCILAVLILAAAWFHGGEQPLRPIAERIDMPEAAQ